MKTLREAMITLWKATRYSLQFSLRNAKKETIGKLIVTIVMTILAYAAVHAIGMVTNAVQQFIENRNAVETTLSGLFNSNIKWPMITLVAIMTANVVAGRFNWFFRWRWHQILHHTNESELNNYRASLDIARFRSKQYDDLSKRIQELPTSWQTRLTFSDRLFDMLSTGSTFVIFGTAIFWHNPIYALILILTSIPMVAMEFKFVAMRWDLILELVPQHKIRHMLQKPYLGKVSFVQSQGFNQMPELDRQIKANYWDVISRFDKIRNYFIRWETLTHLIAVIGLCGVIVHAIWYIASSAGAIGTLVVIIAAARTFRGDLEKFISLVAEQWNNAKGVILIEEEFFGLEPVVKTEKPQRVEFTKPPTIKIENVSFVYPDTDTLTLKDIDLTIESGSKVAIVGRTGHGKSTLQALLMRQYDPTTGTISADGIDLQTITPNNWNEVASCLMQDYTILERKIGDEIASSRLDEEVDLERVAESARFAHFDEVVNDDPDGFESQIGIEFDGREFSGGEKQRLALARAHYRGTPVLILDEPDAKLDPESAEIIMDRIFALQGVTVIIITHHVSRSLRCDKVVVMKDGMIAEQGHPEELLAQNGVYASLFTKDKKRLGLD